MKCERNNVRWANAECGSRGSVQMQLCKATWNSGATFRITKTLLSDNVSGADFELEQPDRRPALAIPPVGL